MKETSKHVTELRPNAHGRAVCRAGQRRGGTAPVAPVAPGLLLPGGAALGIARGWGDRPGVSGPRAAPAPP